MGKTAIILAMVSICLCSCRSRDGGALLPNISGKPSEVLVVLRKELISDSIGKATSSILGDQFPYLPQIEPLFDVVFVTPEAFGAAYKSHRNILLYNIGNKVITSSISVANDVWAAPQTAVTISCPSYKEATLFIRSNRNRLVGIFEQAERERTIQAAYMHPNTGIADVLKTRCGIKMVIASGYKLNASSDNFVWISLETPKTSQGLVVYRFKHNAGVRITAQYLAQKRDELVQQIPGPTAGSHMITSCAIPPHLDSISHKQQLRWVLRGFWDVHQHPMGGPFISHAIIDARQNEVIVAEAYVYAPQGTKRNLLRQTEALLHTVEVME